MDDTDDTAILSPSAARNAASETLRLAKGDSLPDLALSCPTVHDTNEQATLWHRFLHALLRAMAPWPV